MKRIQGLMIAALATTILCGDATADNPFEGIGKGKLLRKFRDDLFGNPDEPEPQPTAAKGPQPAPLSNQQRPNPAANYGANQQPHPNQNAHVNQRGYALQAGGQPRQLQNQVVRPTSATANAQTPAAQLNRVASPGFGMLVQADKANRFVVTQVDPSGNAAKAGLQRGDLITQAGGADLGSLDELNEIVKVLAEGDQLAFQIFRRGQKQEVTIQFGEAKKLPAGESVASLPRTTSRDSQASRYDFVPAQTSGYQSVLERGDNEMPNQPAPRSRAVSTRLSPPSAQTVQNQRQTIEQMQQELNRLRRQQASSVSNNYGESILEGPDLGGPEN